MVGRDALQVVEREAAPQFLLFGPTLAKSFVGEVTQDIPKNATSVPGQFLLELNRAGKFTVELKATCKVTGKETAPLTFPITVLKAK